MKKIIAITTGFLLILGIVSVSTASAGAARRHTIEGFMLGTGVALLGTAILHEMNKKESASPNPTHTYTRGYSERYGKSDYYPNKRYKKYRHHKKYAQRTRGHWESERVWVEPVYEKKWNPGHYNRKGTWVSGRYQRFMVEQGHWSQKKVWVWH